MRKVKWLIFIILTIAIGYSYYKINIAPLLGNLEEKFYTIHVIDITTPSKVVFDYTPKVSYCRSFTLRFSNFLSEQGVYEKEVSRIKKISQKGKEEVEALIGMNIPLEVKIYQSNVLVYKNKIFLNRFLQESGKDIVLYYSKWWGHDCYGFKKGVSYTVEVINSISLKLDPKVKIYFGLKII